MGALYESWRASREAPQSETKRRKKSGQEGRSNLARTFRAYTLLELEQRCNELGQEEELVEGLIPKGAICVLLGESGLGKTPFVYQLGFAVASGKPFLDRRVAPGPVLILDFENGLTSVRRMGHQLTDFFGLPSAPEDLRLWNAHDATDDQASRPGAMLEALEKMIEKIKPRLVIIDPLAGFHSQAEEKNSVASDLLQGLRKLIGRHGVTFVLVHHLKKPSRDPRAESPKLDGPEFRHYFERARGASVLVNGSDVRLGMAIPSRRFERTEVAAYVRGFARLIGEIPGLYLERSCDADGEPLGYEVVSDVALLDNSDQEQAYGCLPDQFRFKNARQVYGKGDQATTDFLKKAIGFGLLTHEGKLYKKLKPRRKRSARSN